jgi:hypothetical protein
MTALHATECELCEPRNITLTTVWRAYVSAGLCCVRLFNNAVWTAQVIWRARTSGRGHEHKQILVWPNVVVERLTLLLRTREVPGSSLGMKTEVFRGFPQSLQTCRDSTLKLGQTAFFHIFSMSSFTYHSFIRCYIVWVTDKTSLNKLQINK